MVKMNVAFTILLVVFVATIGLAAPKTGALPGAKELEQTAKPEVIYEDFLGRSTPQGTVLGFMKSASQGNYEQALQYLDTKITGPKAQKLVDALRVILEHGFSGKLGLLSNKPEGYLDDNLPASKERIGTVKTQTGSVDILLERVQRGDNPPIWLFSTETLKSVPEIYRELDVRTIDAYLPKFLVSTWFLWFPLWKWFLILLLIPILFGLSILATRLFTFLLALVLRRISRIWADEHLIRLNGPLHILVFASAIWVVSLLSQSVIGSTFWTYVALTLTVIGGTWLCVRVIDAIFNLKQRQLAVRSSGNISLVQLGRKLSKILTVIIGILFIFYIAGVNVGAALTGLGIGGIAIAFAAQKTLENLFGGIMIISDQPVRVGDFCRAGEHLGTVENIGLRSTRIRTLDRTVVAVPNGQLALMSLENYTMRDKIWFHHNLHLRYETTADQLRYILTEIQKMLTEHPKIESSTARIRFIGFGESSLNLDVFAYVLETGYEPFLRVQEDLLLRMIDIVESSGSGFAFPSQTTYLAGDVGLDATKSQKIVETIRLWREQGKLPEYPSLESGLRDKKEK